MKLSGKDLHKLRTLVLKSIVGRADLELLAYRMNVQLGEIVASDNNLAAAVHEFLQWLEDHGKTAEFINVLITNWPNQREALAPLLQAAMSAERAVPRAEPETAPRDDGAPAARYTDIQIFNQMGKLQEERSPLVAAQDYTLDVAIRADRKGYTRGRTDQAPVTIIGQVETVRVWVVVTDESDTGSETDDNSESEARLFTFSDRFADLQLPVAGDSEGSARFEFSADRKVLRRVSKIRPRIGVRLYYKLNLIDHVQLDLRVVANPGELSVSKNELAVEVTFKHPERKTVLKFPDSKSATRALNVSVSRNGGGERGDAYLFSFVLGDESGKPVLSGTKKFPESTLNDYVAKFRGILLDTVFGPSLVKADLRVVERDDLLRELSLLGTKIVTELFDYAKSKPTDLVQVGKMVREALAGTSSGISIIQISLSKGAEDFVFPWQILTLADYIDGDTQADPENLWGYHFIIEVKRCGDGTDSRAPATGTRTPVCVTYGRWNFQNEPEHYLRLNEIVNAAPVASRLADPIVETRQHFVAALQSGGGDLVYVYAHGHSATPSSPAGLRFRDRVRQQIDEVAKEIEKNRWLSTAELEEKKKILEQFKKVTSDGADSLLTLTFSAVTLTSLFVEMPPGGRRLGDAPIVILNTCESAQVWNAVEGSFVGFFLDRGARAVLGTETTIPIVVADAFGRAVLEALFQGSSLGEAVHYARLTLLKNGKNPLGLCYSIYGAADARLFFTRAASFNREVTAMKAEIDHAVQTLWKSDANSLYARLGASSVAFSGNPAQFTAPDPTVKVDVSIAGPLDDAIALGKRILKRWNKAIYDLTCGTDGVDPQVKKTILDALKLGKPDAYASAITGVLISFFSVGPGVAMVVGVLFGKVLMPAAGEEICAFWKERL
jgi:hypothetical protein